MTIFKCDRCGGVVYKVYRIYIDGLVAIKDGSYDKSPEKYVPKDLCRLCFEELSNFIKIEDSKQK